MESIGQPWEPLTLWQEDTPANHSASPADEQVPMMNDISGQCSPTVFAWFDPDTQSWKTCQATFLSDSEMSKPIWPRSGMTHDGIAYQLPPSAPRTSATEYSLSLGTHGPNSDGLWPTATTGDHATRFAQGGMPLGMAARMWPTPTASSWSNQGSRALLQQHVEQGDITEEEKNQMVSGNGGRLNPTWVEWLMGFPIGWTDLEDLETQ